MNTRPTLASRLRGGILGSLVGDALGVPVEFQPRAAREADPVTGMRAFGTHRQSAGLDSPTALITSFTEHLPR